MDPQLINSVNRMQVNMSRFQKNELAAACQMNQLKESLTDELEDDSLEFGEVNDFQHVDINRNLGRLSMV